MENPAEAQANAPLFFKHALRPAMDILYEFISDPQARTAISAFWGYQGSPPFELSFLDFGGLYLEFIENKPWHVKGGSQAVSSALINRFEELGGEIRYSCGAERITVSNGKVVGVVTEQGDSISASAVVSNASPFVTYVDLVGEENLPDSISFNYAYRRPSYSVCIAFMGFDKEPSELGVEVGATFYHGTTEVKRAHATTLTLNKPEYLIFSSTDVHNPEQSPPGASQAALCALQYGDPWTQLPVESYADTKYRLADDMLGMIEQAYPNLRGSIEEMEVATPLTFMRYLNHPGGGVLGYDRDMSDSIWFDKKYPAINELVQGGIPIDWFFRAPSCKSPIEGLYLAGASVSRGAHALTMCSGYVAGHVVTQNL